MDKNELKAKYGRIANDPSQLEMFKDDVIDGKVSPLPETPVDPEDKTYTLRFEDGEIKWSEGGSGPTPILGEKTITENGVYNAADDGFDGYSSVDVEVPAGPTPEPVAKGDLIYFGGHRWRVLRTNQDNSETEVMCIDLTALQFDIGQYELVNFTCYDSNMRGAYAYANSPVDVYLENTFLSSLPQDVQDAIIEQEITQDLYSKDGDVEHVVFSSGVGYAYRIFKLSSESVTVGSRHIYLPSVDHFVNYFEWSGQQIAGNLLNTFVTGTASLQSNDDFCLLSSAGYDSSFRSTMYVYTTQGALAFGGMAYLNPVMTVNLTQMSWQNI